jgi:hypothetical protein
MEKDTPERANGFVETFGKRIEQDADAYRANAARP